MSELKERISDITTELNKRKYEEKKSNIDCKSYISNFDKKIKSVLYADNFDKNNQMFIPIRGDCYEDIKTYMKNSGFGLYFKNERINNKDCNCMRLFLYKKKIYFMDWSCGYE